jgi:hypothetical protein
MLTTKTAAVAAVVFLLLGLALTGIGAWVAAKAVIISSEQAQELSATKWNANEALRESLIAQSRSAQRGLWLIVFGTFFQVIGTVLPLLGSSSNTAQ